MDTGIGVLISVVVFGFLPVLNAPLLSQRLAVTEVSSSPESEQISFGQLLRHGCIVHSITQHASIFSVIACYVVLYGLVGLAFLIILLPVICTCWLCCRKSKGQSCITMVLGGEKRAETTKMEEASDVTEADETQSDSDHGLIKLRAKVTRFFKKLKKPKSPRAVKKCAQKIYKELPQEDQNTEEEIAMGNVKVAEETTKKETSEDKKRRNLARMKQERVERDRAELSGKLFKNTHRYSKLCQDLGSRLQKYWMLRGETKQRWSALQFTAKISNNCPFSLEDERSMEALNKLFQDLRHPYLQRVYQVACIKDYVSVLQNYVPEGSLRDRMYRADPMKDWIDKYTHSSHVEVLDVKEVATCICHIGEALLALYEIGFPAIGQVHTGNIFLKDGKYILGGFENTLLGYRSSLYAAINKEGLLDAIDIIMLGHLVYEISSGTPLQEICPSKDFNFERVGNPEVQEFIRFVFRVDVRKSNIKAIKEILNHPFLKNVQAEKRPPLEITQQAKYLLQVITHQESGQTMPWDSLLSDLDIIQLTEKIAADYTDRRAIERIGWRPQKMWATANHSMWGKVLLSAAVVPYTCPIYIQKNMKDIKEILDAVQQHPNIHGVLEMFYMKEGGKHITVSVEFLKKSSLRDLLYKSDPLEKWEKKYKKVKKHFNTKQIAHYGSQVLDALLFLYNLGFPPTGQITSGNIFIEGDNCQLSGYDNVLLGHRTESYTSIKEFTGPDIDVFMFGTVLLEMATGKHMTSLPTKQDCKHETKELKELFECIFEQKHSITKIRNHPFFEESRSDEIQHIPSLSKSAQVLLQKVYKGKWRDQAYSFII